MSESSKWGLDPKVGEQVLRDIAMQHSAFNQIAMSIVRSQTRLVERCLIGAVEQIEGRVPSDDEVRQHGRRMIVERGGEIYEWKGVPILEIPIDALKFVDMKMVFEIRTVFKEERSL